MTTIRRDARRIRLAALVVAPLLVLVACGGNSDSADMNVDSAPAGAPAEDGLSYSDNASTADAERAGDQAAEGGSAKNRPAPITRAVISTGTVSLVSDDVAATRREVQRIADAQGGQIGEEKTESNDDGEAAYARMVLRVPVDHFDAAMGELEKAADLRVSGRSSEDVTTQVIDTDVRVRAQQASLKRVEALLARAQQMRDIVWIESQLTQRQAELDSLRQQQAWLSDQTSLSTITVDITLPPTKADRDHDDDGFLVGLKGGWKALAATATALATATGALLPFTVVLLVLGMPAWLLLRGRRRRRTVGA